jgi:hypothetical protein
MYKIAAAVWVCEGQQQDQNRQNKQNRRRVSLRLKLVTRHERMRWCIWPCPTIAASSG